jgi:predicted ATP-grasp superfamily ATP-dependent carboligase
MTNGERRIRNGERICIVGASARAAAFSALRAGLEPWSVDLFGDVDLVAIGHSQRVKSWQEVPTAVARFEKEGMRAPWMYTGACENRPRLIELLSRGRMLWGNDAAIVEPVRSPRFLQTALERAGIAFPETRFAGDSVPRDGTWLVKPFAGGGGRGIAWWRGQKLRHDRAVYFQRFVRGVACAACFVGDGSAAELLGVTRQLIGDDWLHAKPFHYCGSIGPLAIDERQRAAFARLGDVLGACRLRGHFGVDCIMSDDTIWVIEVNPRYTASVELIELATGVPAFRRHACVFVRLPTLPSPAPAGGIVGKAILFAPKPVVFPNDGPWSEALRIPPERFRPYADIPAPGTELPKGAPVMTIFAQTPNPEACLRELRQIVAELDQRLFTT